MVKPQWIVSDLDETLLRNDGGVSKYTHETLTRVRAKGVKFCIATTRGTFLVRPLVEILKPDAMVICGGALGIVEGEIVYSRTLQEPLIAELLEELKPFPIKRPTVVDYSKGSDGGGELLFKGEAQGAQQILAWLEGPLPQEFLTRWRGEVTITEMWLPHLYRFSNPEATKRDAVSYLLRKYHPTEVVAFGDDPLDAGMLELFQGVAVANASQESLAAAKYHALSNEEDGVAHWLERHLLSRS
ncbi:MAG: HAD family hydrolase [Sphaerochaetaceae bacterium]